jgi:threonine dehydratase
VRPVESIALEDVRAAKKRVSGLVVRTPLLHLNTDNAPAEIYLKPENLQPIGPFKIRGLGYAILQASAEQLAKGVWTASMGNAAQTVAWHARRLGLPCTIVVPEVAVEAKLVAISRLGGRIVKTSYETWWQTFQTREFEGQEGLFIHPFADPAVIAGNGTISLEILKDVPDVDSIVVPFGGGGLSCGIATAAKAVKPSVRVYACEVETAAPLAASLAAGSPQTIKRMPSFVDGIGAAAVAEDMWPLVSRWPDGSIVVTLEEIASAIRLLAQRNWLSAEGAGASSVAAALTGRAGKRKVVCIISGGNIDAEKLSKILQGRVPVPD